MPTIGELEGETGEADSSDEEESETEPARSRRTLMGMGLLCGTLPSVLEVMVTTSAVSKGSEEQTERGAEEERSFRRNAGSDAVYESRTLGGA